MQQRLEIGCFPTQQLVQTLSGLCSPLLSSVKDQPDLKTLVGLGIIYEDNQESELTKIVTLKRSCKTTLNPNVDVLLQKLHLNDLTSLMK